MRNGPFDPFVKDYTELEGCFTGVVFARADTGRLVVRGLTGPRKVVMPRSLAARYDIGSEVRYTCVMVRAKDGRVSDVAMVTRLV
jgi:hypothetical protein